MTRYLDRDRWAVLAAVVAPLALSTVLLPLRRTFSHADVALALVVVVVAVAASGHRIAGALAALSAAVWFDFFFT
ncbi:MAG: Osmosensitive channel histidine kinaselike protein, partial [Streptosporangiaceae bacterium]|nr:Osmosensitive channel histidine kinaselike protein [Streptosporangiaceae bacterium]